MSVTAELADGRRLEFPDGTDPAVIRATVKKMMTPETFAKIKEEGNAVKTPVPFKAGAEGFPDAMRETTRNASWGARNLAAAGTAITNPYQGAKQRFGTADNPAIQANRILEEEAPVGAFAGNAGLLALAPSTSIAGAGLLGGFQGAYRPTQGEESVAGNTVLGGLLGMGGQLVGNKAGNYLTNRLATQEAKGGAEASRNSVRDTTLRNAQNAGYVVSPSTVNPSTVNKLLESLAGKDAVKQETAVRNQEVTNALIRKSLGLPDDAPITEATIKQVRDLAAQPYRDVAALSKDAADALEMLKAARFDATAQYKHYNRSADPAALARAKTSRGEAQGWEDFIEGEAKSAGNPALVDSLRKGRQKIAQTFDAEGALNTSTGNVVATDLGKLVDKGRPMTGEMATVGNFANAFPQFAREGTHVPPPGVSKVQALSAALLGSIGGAPAAALPFLSAPVRSLILSRPYQNLMATPKYGPGMTTKALGQLDSDKAALLAKSLFLTAQ